MRANRYQASLSTEVLMELVLQVYEAIVPRGIKADPAEHRPNHKGPDERSLWLDHNALEFLA